MRTIDFGKPPIMVPAASFMLDRVIEEAVHKRIQDGTFGAEPWSPRTLGVHSYIEDILRRRWDRAGNGDFGKIHRDSSFFATKNFSKRSMRRFQNRS